LSPNLVPYRFPENPPNYKDSTMNHQSLTQRLFRFFPALFTLAALGLVGWAVVDRPAPSTTAPAVSLTTTSAADSPSSAVGTDVRRRIEDVRVGDLVWAYDELTGQLEKRPVTALFRSQTDHLRVLTLESESGQRQRIETTDEHPFWVVGYGWQDAQLLRPGDRLLEPDQSHVTVIASVREEHPGGLTVYNFEVAGLHDYFVSATATDSLVLSHNMCSKGGGGADSGMLYRGVPGNRTEKAILGQQGIAKPRGAATDPASLRRHVLGEDVDSGVVSFTTDRSVARRFSGSDGTIIEVPRSAVQNRIVPRPEVGKYGNEAEVLIRGTVQGTPTRP
jgi:hypothetical protein